jgi:hypothetical protein
MGWTVLYIAFGVVALWLLGEVLLQYKARLRYRLLAFVGFLGVVVGVLIPSVVVIGVGAVAFAIGQTYVTLSFRRGFAAGWALRGVPGLSRGRDDDEYVPPAEADAEPRLRVSDLEAVPVAQSEPPAYQPEPPAYQPEPMPDDTGEYGVYDDSAYASPSYASTAYGNDQGGYSPYETYGGYGSQDAQGQGYGGHSNGQDVYADAGQYGYPSDAYAAYNNDPYGGAQGQPYGQQQAYGQQQYADPYAAYGQDPYGAGTLGGDHYAADTAYGSAQQYAPGGDAMQPGGAWVPQQREGDAPPAPEQPPYPYQQQGFQQGYDEQYRY